MTDTPDFGAKTFTGVGYPTPVSIPDETACRTLQIPADGAWQAIVMGALDTLTLEYNWQQFEGGITREAAAARALQMVNDCYAQVETNQCDTMIGTPYWDTAADVSAEASVGDQTWYGEVTNPTAPAAELDFVENVSLWIVSGMVAIATGSIGAALAFRTVVSKFILIQRAGDVGETIRYVVDNQDITTINTADVASGTLIQVPVVADPTISPHQIYIVKTG